MIIICSVCSKLFEKSVKHVNQSIKYGWKEYCSIACQMAGKRNGKECICEKCSKTFYRPMSYIKKHVYCSRICANSTNNPKHVLRGKDHPNYIDGLASKITTYRKLALDNARLTETLKCSVCGYDIELILEVHHKDKDRSNCVLSNLDVLCPTHHKEYNRGLRRY